MKRKRVEMLDPRAQRYMRRYTYFFETIHISVEKMTLTMINFHQRGAGIINMAQ